MIAARALSDGMSRVRPNGTLVYEMALGHDCVLRCRTVGFWSMADAETYLADLGRLLHLARGASGSGRLLIDLRGSSVQSIDVTARLFSVEDVMLGPSDWRAFVVESRLKMSQLRRGILFAGTQVFASPVDAERWLAERG